MSGQIRVPLPLTVYYYIGIEQYLITYAKKNIMEPKLLKELFTDLTYTVAESCRLSGEELSNLEIAAVVSDGRELQEGCLFICCRDTNYNGPSYLAQAIEAGAAVIVTERAILEEAMPEDAADAPAFIFVDDARYAMAFIYAAWYNHPADKLLTIGITGTKGKTTTAYMLYDMLRAAGRKAGLISTVEYIIGDEHIESLNTTPEAPLLQNILHRMVQAGLDSVVMEVTSTALQYHRSQGFILDIGMFTNIGNDHIGPGESRDFDHYLQCKSRLFRQCRMGIVNIDDPNAERIIEGHTCELKTFGLSEDAEYRAFNIACEMTDGRPGVLFDVTCPSLHVHIPMPGEYTVRNALGAIAVAHQLRIQEDAILSALAGISVPGRFNVITKEDSSGASAPVAVVDFAHNPMSLQAIITALRQYYKGKIFCIFGCGGDMYRSKRPDMGAVSTELADFVYITNDNPRFEDPGSIIKDILSGIPKDRSNYAVIPDRREAVLAAFAQAAPGDVVLLAGKGTERYQNVRGVKYPCDDSELAREALDLYC